MFKLAELFVDIRADQAPFQKAMGDVHSSLTKAGVAVGTFVGNLASAMARAATSMAGGLFGSTIGEASHLNETLSKTGVVFGESASTVTRMADEMAEKFGLNKRAMLDAADVFGLMGKGAGMTADEMASFSNRFVELAVDAKSFHDVPFEEALERIRSGLSGEAEPLRKFGVFLTEAAVKAEAAAMGIGKVGRELTEGEKIMARASLITKGMAPAIGDMDRTFSGTQNQMEGFWGRLANMGTKIGELVMPIWDKLLAGATWALKGIDAWLEQNRETVKSWVASIVDGLDSVGAAFRNIRIIAAGFWGGFESVWTNITEIVSAASQNIVNLARWLGNNFFNLIKDAFEATKKIFTNFGENVVNFGGSLKEWWKSGKWDFQWKGLLTGFDAVTDALPEMIKPKLTNPIAAALAAALRAGMEEVANQGGGGEGEKGIGAMMRDVMARQSRMMGIGGGTGIAAEKEKKAEIVGAAEFSEKLRLGQGAEIPKQQLDELKMIREIEKEQAERFNKLLDRTFFSALA